MALGAGHVLSKASQPIIRNPLLTISSLPALRLPSSPQDLHLPLSLSCPQSQWVLMSPWWSQGLSQPFSAVTGSCQAEPRLYSLSLDAGDGGVEGCLDVRHGAGGYDQLLVRLELLTHVLPMQRARVKAH